MGMTMTQKILAKVWGSADAGMATSPSSSYSFIFTHLEMVFSRLEVYGREALTSGLVSIILQMYELNKCLIVN